MSNVKKTNLWIWLPGIIIILIWSGCFFFNQDASQYAAISSNPFFEEGLFLYLKNKDTMSTLGVLFTGLAFSAMFSTLIIQKKALEEQATQMNQTALANESSIKLTVKKLELQSLVFWLEHNKERYNEAQEKFQKINIEEKLGGAIPLFMAQERDEYAELIQKYRKVLDQLEPYVK